MEIPLEAYASYVPRLVVDLLAADPRPPSEPTAQQFVAAVLFADIAGFTSLTERLARRGPAGSEQLTTLLNDYFGQLIDLIDESGGDILKFAGDALLAVWRADLSPSGSDQGASSHTGIANEESTAADSIEVTLRASRCALDIRGAMRAHRAGDEQLDLRISVACGDVSLLQLGGVFGRWELMVSGEPLVEIGRAAQPPIGEVVLANSAWTLIADRAEGESLAAGGTRLMGLTDRTRAPIRQPARKLSPAAQRGLNAFIPGAILSRMAAGHSAWISELRQLTVLFVKLPGLNHKTPVETAQSIVHSLQQLLYRYEGSINKLSADEKGITLLAAFGLPPLMHEDDAVRGLLAALDMQTQLADLETTGSIGVATGQVFCGSIGNQKRREYTVMGDTVNLSARLMQAADGQVLCDELTRKRAEPRFHFGEPLAISVKGKRDPVNVFRPLGLLKPTQTTASPLVGRRSEIGVLEEAINALRIHSRSATVIVAGEPGIGKSRLIEEAVQFALAWDVGVLSGSGDPIEKSAPYHAWRSVFAQLFGLDSVGAGVDEARALVQAELESDAELQRFAPLLNVVLPLDLPENEMTSHMDPATRATNTVELLLALLQHRAASKPLLLVLEDAHWFDSSSWILAERAAAQVTPLVLLVGTRPLEGRSPDELERLKSSPATHTVQLGPLTEPEANAMVCCCLEVDQIPPSIVSWILRRSEGQPFFIEELAYSLRDSEFIRVSDRQCRVMCPEDELGRIEFPNALQSVIASRLDRLAPQEQLLVKTASTIGRLFPYELLYDVYPIEPERVKLPEYLDELDQRDIVQEELNRSERTYRFKHALTQEAAYRQMLFAQRRQLHQAIAQWYESSNRGGSSQSLSLLAHHWEKAEETDKALHYCAKAGDFALRTGAYLEAVTQLGDAVRLLGKSDASEARQQREAGLQRKLGQAQLGLGKLPDSRDHSRRALALLQQDEPTTAFGRAVALSRQTLIHVTRRFMPRRQAKPEVQDEILEATRTYEQLAEIHYMANDTLGLLHACLRNLHLAEKLGPCSELARACATVGVTAGTIPLHRVAKSHLRRARAIAENLDEPPTRSWVHLATGIYRVGVGQWTAARESLQTVLEICDDLADRRRWGVASTILGGSYYFCGDFHEGIRLWTELHEQADRRGDVLHQAWGFGGQALNALRLGETDKAARFAESALNMFRTNADRVSEITTSGVLAVARLRQGEPGLARQAAETAFQQIRELKFPTAYYLLEGYAAVAEVFLAEWETLSQQSLPVPRANRVSVKAAMRAMKSYARVFPIGRPRECLLRGRYRWLCGRTASAQKVWRAGIQVAKNLDMKYEQGLLHFELAKRTTDRDCLRQATDQFRLLGAAFDLDLAERL